MLRTVHAPTKRRRTAANQDPPQHPRDALPLQLPLQVLFDDAMRAPSKSKRARFDLIALLADRNEIGALIALWDKTKAMNLDPASDARSWSAVTALHKRQKRKGGKAGIGKATELRVPPSRKRSLAPSRRLHKICKGKRMSARASAAKEYVDAAISFLDAERAAGRAVLRSDVESGKGRIKLAKRLKRELNIATLETARGLVTTLKRKRVF